MAYRRLSQITDLKENPKNTWCYEVDAESDMAGTLPDECVVAIVLEPDSGKSPVRMKNTSGVWKEVG